MPEAGEVDGAGDVECFLGCADGESGEQDGVFVAVAGGGVDGEAEGVGGAAVAQPEQRGEQLSETLLAFVDRDNQTARPFNWKFTASDLTDLLRRISEQEQQAATQHTDLAQAA